MSDEVKLQVDSLVTSSDVANILGISKQRVQQIVIEKLLPPCYIFNHSSKRKFYLFERRTVAKYLKDGWVKWKEPKVSSLLSIPDVAERVGCPQPWVYEAVRNGKLATEIVIKGDGKHVICLFKSETVEAAWKDRIGKAGKKGYREKTLKLIEKIKKLHRAGMNDSEIAGAIGAKQPLVTKLRNQIGLSAICGRGRPRLDGDEA